MTQTTSTTTTTLTPIQFTVARALAHAYSHLWATVPDGTYDIEAIRAYGSSQQTRNLPAGIEAPDVILDLHEDVVVLHTTGTGRLSWKVYPNGAVLLEVNRPQLARLPYERGYKTEDILVARVDVMCDTLPLPLKQTDIILHSSDYRLRYVEGMEGSFLYDEDVEEQYLFERHAYALVRPIVALLTIGREYQQASMEEGRYEAWRETVLNPAIATAREWLKPLINKALPDPCYQTREVFFEEGSDIRRWRDIPLPETHYRKMDQFQSTGFIVSHHGEEFPVESEKTAVHAVLLLKQHPDTSLVEAIKRAVQAQAYRTETEA